MANSITGRIKAIGAIQSIPSRDGQSTFYKRILTLDVTQYDRYTGERGRENTPQIEFAGERNAAKLEGFAVGQLVTVNFALEGHPYTSKSTGQEGIINSIQGYSIELYGGRRDVSAPTPAGQEQPAEPVAAAAAAQEPAPVQKTPQPYSTQQEHIFGPGVDYGAQPARNFNSDLPF